MSAAEAAVVLARAIEIGTDDLLTDDEAAKLLRTCPDEFRRMRTKLVGLGARCFEMPSTSPDPKRRRLRWSRNSLLALARGLGDRDGSVAGGGR